MTEMHDFLKKVARRSKKVAIIIDFDDILIDFVQDLILVSRLIL